MDKFITVKPHGGWAGIGHQFTNWLVPNILAQRYSLKFIHQPFVGETDGTYTPQGSNAYQVTRPVKEWNNFLNFGNGELTLQDLPEDLLEINLPYIEQEKATWDHIDFKYLLENDLGQIAKPNTLYKVSENKDGQFLCIDWDFYKNNNLKIKYNNSEQIKNFKCYFDKDKINVAIAIRRGDVTKIQQFRRWMSLEYYLNIMENISNIKELKDIVFHIYAWDMPQEEKNILLLHSIFGKTYGCTRKIELHIDEDVFSTFYHFTKADIFVSGQGAFSLMANYLTDAVKLTTPFYMHWRDFPKNIRDIIEVYSDGSFDTLQLLREIENKNTS